MNPFKSIQRLGISQEEYFKLEGYSSTDLRRLKRDRNNPYGMKKQKEGDITVTDAMRFGSALDCSILEPHLFKQRYIFEPDEINRPTTDKQVGFIEGILTGKDAITAYGDHYAKPTEAKAESLREDLSAYIALQKLMQESDQEVLPFADKTRLRGCVDAVHSHSRFGTLMAQGEPQIVYTAEAFGVPWKGMIDLARPGVVTDFKSTGDWNGRKYNFFRRGYHIQLTLYAWLHGATAMEVFFVESDSPFRTSLTNLEEQFGAEELAKWEETTLDLMQRIAHAHKTGDWLHTMEYAENRGYEYL